MRKKLNYVIFPNSYFAIHFFLYFFVFATISYAQDTVEPKEPHAAQAGNENYAYVIEGRSDPFKPFISLKASTLAERDPNEIVEDDAELTGMRIFEPGQLTLVGVLLTDVGEIALVEDQTKKGYMLKQGDLIGKRGIVTQINKKQVLITETAHTRAGEEIKSTVTMRLKKEGDK